MTRIIVVQLLAAGLGFLFGALFALRWAGSVVKGVLAAAMEKQGPAEAFNYVLDRFGINDCGGDER